MFKILFKYLEFALYESATDGLECCGRKFVDIICSFVNGWEFIT